MNNDSKKGGNLQYDLYEDCILMIDEEQFAASRKWIFSGLGALQQHEWTILMMPTAGSMDLDIGAESHTCGVGQVLVCLLSDGIVVRHMTDDFAARTIGMSINFTNGLQIGNSLSSGLAVRREPVLAITQQVGDAIRLIFDQLRGIINAADNPYRFRAVQLMVETFYYTIGYYLHRDTDTLIRTGGEWLTDRFLHLMKREFKLHRDIGYYADSLHVSKKHLSATVCRTTGKPVSHWISHSVVLWAKQQLEHSTLTVGQIADELHFANQSHFGTYFKRVTGQSPETYRNNLRDKSDKRGQVEFALPSIHVTARKGRK